MEGIGWEGGGFREVEVAPNEVSQSVRQAGDWGMPYSSPPLPAVLKLPPVAFLCLNHAYTLGAQ